MSKRKIRQAPNHPVTNKLVVITLVCLICGIWIIPFRGRFLMTCILSFIGALVVEATHLNRTGGLYEDENN